MSLGLRHIGAGPIDGEIQDPGQLAVVHPTWPETTPQGPALVPLQFPPWTSWSCPQPPPPIVTLLIFPAVQGVEALVWATQQYPVCCACVEPAPQPGHGVPTVEQF